MRAVPCSIDQCSRTAWRRGWCSVHYARWRNKGDADADVRPYQFRDSDVCSLDGCDRPVCARGWCRLHYDRWKAHGDPLAKTRRGPNGSVHTNADGYRVLRANGHPNAGRGGQILEHRLIMSDLLGRPLLPTETVHHINGVKDDNSTDGPLVNFRSGNLELWTGDQPAGQRVEDKVQYALALLALYRPELLAADQAV